MKALIGSFVLMALVASVQLTSTQAQAPAAPSVYTAAQAAAGHASYQANCSSCHQPTLAGQNEAPPLAGANFMTAWSGRTTKDLVDYMSATMPPGRPSLAEADYLNITAFILQFNGATAGAQPLVVATAAPIGTIATGQRAAAAAGGGPRPAGAAGAGPAGRPAAAPPARGLS